MQKNNSYTMLHSMCRGNEVPCPIVGQPSWLTMLLIFNYRQAVCLSYAYFHIMLRSMSKGKVVSCPIVGQPSWLTINRDSKTLDRKKNVTNSQNPRHIWISPCHKVVKTVKNVTKWHVFVILLSRILSRFDIYIHGTFKVGRPSRSTKEPSRSTAAKLILYITSMKAAWYYYWGWKVILLMI